MKFFLDLPIQSKILWLMALNIFLLAGLLYAANEGINAIQKSQNNLYERDFVREVSMMGFGAHENGALASEVALILSKSKEERQAWDKELKEHTGELDNFSEDI